MKQLMTVRKRIGQANARREGSETNANPEEEVLGVTTIVGVTTRGYN